MALPSQPIHIPAGLPIDESTRQELLDAGAANVANINVRVDKRGALSKRPGFHALGVDTYTGTLPGARRLISHNSRTIVVDTSSVLNDYNEAGEYFIDRSPVPHVSVDTTTVSTNGDTLLDACSCNGYIAVATRDGLSVVVTLRSTSDTTISQYERFISTASGETALLATYGTYIFLFANDPSTNAIVVSYLNVATKASIISGWVSLGSLITNKSSSGISALALSTQSLVDRVSVAYVNTGGGASRVTVSTIDITGILQTATINTSSVVPEVVCVEGSFVGGHLWVAWNQTTSVYVAAFDPTDLAVVEGPPTLIFSGTFATGGTAAPFLVARSSDTCLMGVNTTSVALGLTGQSVPSIAVAQPFGSGGVLVAGTTHSIVGVTFAARPVFFDSRAFAMFHAGDEANGLSVFGEWTDVMLSDNQKIIPIAWAFPGLVNLPSLRSSHAIVDATSCSYALMVSRSATGRSSDLVTFAIGDRKIWRSESHNRSLFLSGGILSYYDGNRVAEASYLYSPLAPVATDSGAGAGVTGPVRYVATYEDVDDDGNWSVSGVSAPSAALSITDNIATVRVAPLSLTRRLVQYQKRKTRVVIYRTKSGGSPPYYFVADAIVNPQTLATFSDGLTDAILGSRRLLYGTGALPGTNGAAQDRRAPPFCQDVKAYNGMLVVASASELWWSGQTVFGEGPWWSPAFVVTVPGDGYVTALAAQDGTLYAFKRDSIYATVGEAPSDNGAFGGLGEPRRLSVDVGCIDPCSVVVTSLGVFFQSERGIELLSRSGEVTWIGEQIQSTLATYPVVSSAVLDDRNGLVRFSLATTESSGVVASGTNGGRDVVFDLSLGYWVSVDKKTSSAAVEGAASQDAAMIEIGGKRRYAWVTPGGVIHAETLSAAEGYLYGDASNYIFSEYTTPPIKVGLQSDQRVYEMELLFERHVASSGLTLVVDHDYATSGGTSKVWTGADIPAGTRQVSFRPLPNSTAVRVTVRDTQGAALGTGENGQGYTFIGLSADIAPKQGATRGTSRLNPILRR